jgi:hypothetical protein
VLELGAALALELGDALIELLDTPGWVRARLSKPRNCTGVAEISREELLGARMFVGLARLGACISMADAVVSGATCTTNAEKEMDIVLSIRCEDHTLNRA